MCGIILGIFDFDRMDEEEIYDTIIPIIPHNQSFVVLCRGNLLKLTRENDFIQEKMLSNIIVSPYVLISNMLLAYNEYILKTADTMLTQDYKNSKISSLEKLQLDVKNILNIQYLQNVFQYPSERNVVEYGSIQRGINYTYDMILKKIDMLSEEIGNRRSNKAIRSDAVLNALLACIAALQIKNMLLDFFDFDKNDIISGIIIIIFGVVIFLLVISKKDHK